MTPLSTQLQENIHTAKQLLPIPQSFDIVTRELYLGTTKAYWLGINGLCQTDLLQQIFSDLQDPLYMEEQTIEELSSYLNAKIGYVQASLADSWEPLLLQLLSGPSVLLVDGFAQAILLDVRSYPGRSVEEPQTEQVTSGSRDGFVETLLTNANLIRRRLRTPGLTFEILTIGSLSHTDVALAYINGWADPALVHRLQIACKQIKATTLTMGAASLKELLVPQKWYHPLPSVHMTQRPDVACSFLSEGYAALLVDNSPSVLILPCSLFQFTQSPEDYYKSPSTGNYFRLVRFLCLPVNLLLMPLFLLMTVHYPQLSEKLRLLSTPDTPGPTLIFYCFAVELFLDLFKYAATLGSNRFSGALALVGGLVIGDIAVDLRWANPELLFYGALTLLTSLALSSIAFADGLRIYRLFLLLTTALGGVWGFGIGLLAILISVATTPVFGGRSYLWPLFPLHRASLRALLFRKPTYQVQPERKK